MYCWLLWCTICFSVFDWGCVGVSCVVWLTYGWGGGPKNGGPKTVKNGPRVWAFCKIEFPGIQKPVQFFGQKSTFFRNPGNRGVGVIWLVRGLVLGGSFSWWLGGCCLCFGCVLVWVVLHVLFCLGVWISRGR